MECVSGHEACFCGPLAGTLAHDWACFQPPESNLGPKSPPWGLLELLETVPLLLAPVKWDLRILGFEPGTISYVLRPLDRPQPFGGWGAAGCGWQLFAGNLLCLQLAASCRCCKICHKTLPAQLAGDKAAPHACLQVVGAIMRTLWKVTFGNTEFTDDLVKQNGIPEIIAAMKKYPANEDIAEYGNVLLYNISLTPKYCAMVAKEDGLASLLATMRGFTGVSCIFFVLRQF